MFYIGGKKSIKEHVMSGKRTGKIIFAVLNVLILGFIFGALSGDVEKIDPNLKWGLILGIILAAILILICTPFNGTVAKIATMFFILAYAVLGVAELAVTKPDIGIRVEILGYLAILFLAFNWMYIHWRMCKLCK
jgi:hypothetical protein